MQCSHSFQNKLQDDAESSNTFINKAVLTLASYTRTVYNKIPVCYHLSFAFMETNSNLGLFQHLFCLVSINCFLFLMCLHIFGNLFKILLPLAFSVTLLNRFYFALFWEDIEMI